MPCYLCMLILVLYVSDFLIVIIVYSVCTLTVMQNYYNRSNIISRHPNGMIIHKTSILYTPIDRFKDQPTPKSITKLNLNRTIQAISNLNCSCHPAFPSFQSDIRNLTRILINLYP